MTRFQAERIEELLKHGWDTQVPEPDKKEDILYGGPIPMVKGNRRILVLPNGHIEDSAN